MSVLKITNVSGESLWLRDLYTTLGVDETRQIKRTSAEMGDMIGLQELVGDGLVVVDIELEEYEAPSELIAVWPLGLNWRPTVPTVLDLPTEKNRGGDTRMVSSTLEMYVWSGTAWVKLSGGGSGAGTVTSVNASGGATGLSFSGGPVTTTGTLTLGGTLSVASGGTGATSAAGAQTNLDVPSRSGSGATGTWAIDISGSASSATNLIGGDTNKLPYQTSAGVTGFLDAPTVANTVLKWNGTAFVWSFSNGGTVKSVDVSGGTTGLVFSGGPVTTTGVITLSGTLGLGNGGTGATSAADARTNLDVPTRSGGDATGTWAIDITGNAATADTATNLANGAANQLVFQSGAGTTSFVTAPSTSDTYLRYDGATFGWATISGGGTGTVTSVDASGGTTGLSFTGGPISSSGTLTLSGTLATTSGGTGQTSYSDGQLLIGNSAGSLTKATLTAGTGIAITNGNGSIEISSTGASPTAYQYTVEFNAAPTQPAVGEMVFSNSILRFNEIDGNAVNRSYALFELLGVTPTLNGAAVGIVANVVVLLEKIDQTAYATSTFLLSAGCTVSYYSNASGNIIQIQSPSNLGWTGFVSGGTGFWKPQPSNPEPGVFALEAFQLPGGGSAPTTAQYVTLAADASLTNERVLAVSSDLTLTDGGAGGNVTVGLAPTSSTHESYDTLVHNIAESNYQEVVYTDGLVESIIYWTSAAKTLKIRETTFAYDPKTGLVTDTIAIQYDGSGASVTELSSTYSYNLDGTLASITTVRT